MTNKPYLVIYQKYIPTEEEASTKRQASAGGGRGGMGGRAEKKSFS